MKFYRFKSEEPHSPYAPSWDFNIGHSHIGIIDVKELSKTILDKEKDIKKLPLTNTGNKKFFDGNTGLGKNSITSRSNRYNILTWNTRETNHLKEQIKLKLREYNNENGKETPTKVWIQCWANILRFRQKIKSHSHGFHSYSYLSGHFSVQVNDTSTVYINPLSCINSPELYTHRNESGVLTLFPTYIPHYTTLHNSFRSRITIAFDMTLDPLAPFDEKTFVLL